MNVEQAILNHLQVLPLEKQKLLLEFAKYLVQQLIPQEEADIQEKELTNNPISPQERARNWQKWAKNHPIAYQRKVDTWQKWAGSHKKPSPALSDEAISRETIYE